MTDISAENSTLPVRSQVVNSTALQRQYVIDITTILTGGDRPPLQTLQGTLDALYDLSILNFRGDRPCNMHCPLSLIAETLIDVNIDSVSLVTSKDGIDAVRPRCRRILVICKITTSDIPSSSAVTPTFFRISSFVVSFPSFFVLPLVSFPQPVYTSDVQSQMSTLDLRVVRFLGEGTSGKVYLVDDQLSRARVALKVVPKEGKSEHALGVVLKERKIAEKLADSPWFVGLWVAWSDKRNLYIAMPAYPTDLDSEMLRCGTIEPDRARFYMAEIIIALTELHSRGIIHRDIKAPNVLIDCEGHIVLADFGLSKDFGERPTIAERVFQPYWPYFRNDNPTSESPPRAPEQLTFVAWDYRGSELEMAPEVHLRMPYSFGVDFWSAAVVLYWMLTGRPPFYVDDDEQFKCKYESRTKLLIQKIAEYPLFWDPADDVNDVTKEFLERMMDKDPKKRLMISYEMLNHPYFIETNWTLMEERRIPPPWIPPPGVGHLHEPTSPPFTPGEPFTADDPDPYPEFNFISKEVAGRAAFGHDYEGTGYYDYDDDLDAGPLSHSSEDDEGSDTMTDLADVSILQFESDEDFQDPVFVDPRASPSDLRTLKSENMDDIPLKEAWNDSFIIVPLPTSPYGPKRSSNVEGLTDLQPFVAEMHADIPASEPLAPPGLDKLNSAMHPPSTKSSSLSVDSHSSQLSPLTPRRRGQSSEQSESDSTSTALSTPQRTRHIVNGTGLLFKLKVWISRLWPPKSQKTDQLKRLSLLC